MAECWNYIEWMVPLAERVVTSNDRICLNRFAPDTLHTLADD
jgi:hypothetical protein